MPAILLAHVLLLAQLAYYPLVRGTPNPLTPEHATAVEPAAGTAASTTQPSAQLQGPLALPRTQADNLADAFGHWTIGKLFKGEKKLSPEDLGHLEFWVSLVKEPLTAVLGFVPRLFASLVFLVVFWLFYRGMRRVVLGGMSRAHVDQSIRDMLGHLIKWGVMGFGLVIAFNQIGIQITALLTGVSIVGLAVGLAAQETLANFIAAIVIIWDEPFRVGHIIELDTVVGTVQRVTFRSTRILNGDGAIIVLPNTYVLAHQVSNHTVHPVNRVNIPLVISWDASVDEARTTLLALCSDDARICATPAPAVVVSDCLERGVKIGFSFWVRDKTIAAAMNCAYMEKAKKALDAAQIPLGITRMQLTLPDAEIATRPLRAAS